MKIDMTQYNDENKFIALLLGITLVMIGSIAFSSCKTKRSVVDNTTVKTDSTCVVIITTDSTTHNTTLKDSTLHKHTLSDSTVTSEAERHDTYIKNFNDHYLYRTDSVDVKIDSITGNITYYYYTRTYEKDIVRDTVLINNSSNKSSYVSHEESDSLLSYKLKLDSLTRDYMSIDSSFRSLRDSINSLTETTVIEKQSWWDKCKTMVTMIVMIVIISCLCYTAFKLYQRLK